MPACARCRARRRRRTPRRGANTFAVTRETLRYDDEVGALFAGFGRGEFTRPLALPFAFPFGNLAHEQVTISAMRGIHFADRPSIPAKPFEAIEMIAGAPLISPLFDYQNSPGGKAIVFVKSTAETVTITFRREFPSLIDYDLQAQLFANGDIRFSYKRVENIAWGGVVVTTGGDSWMRDTATLATIDDPAGDVEPLFGASREMLDIRSVEIARVAGSSLLELRIRTAAPIDQTVLREGSSYLIYLGDSLNRVEVFVFADRLQVSDSVIARIDGSDVVMYVAEEWLSLAARTVKVWAYTNSFSVADSASATIDLGYRDDEIDAVAIYTSFLSDIILTRYGAFATLANPGANGVSQHSSKSQPRTPTLMHMNMLGTFAGASSTQILLHELGHRWLYYFDIQEDGANRRAVNPLGYHPAQWVHTPGAFASNASPMGGALFTDNRNGTFTTAAADARDAFTWHELYLMGLARPEEVQPWFYLRGTTLGDEYHPPVNVTVSGTRVDVNVQQLIAAMGPRAPSFDSSQKSFRVPFVVLVRDGAPQPSLGTLRSDFERAFDAATGGRGRVVTGKTGGKRRAVTK